MRIHIDPYTLPVESDSTGSGRLPVRSPLPSDEISRQRVLKGAGMLHSQSEDYYHRITAMVRRVFKVAICSISLLDKDCLIYKSVAGVNIPEGSRDDGLNCFVIQEESPDIIVVPDTLNDSRSADWKFVVNRPNIRFYAGTVIRVANVKIGSLCICGPEPRDLTKKERLNLEDFGAMISDLISENSARVMVQESELAQLTIATMCSLQLPLSNLTYDCEQLILKQKSPSGYGTGAVRRSNSYDSTVSACSERSRVLDEKELLVRNFEDSLNHLTYLVETSLTTAIATSSTLIAANKLSSSSDDTQQRDAEMNKRSTCNIVDTFLQFKQNIRPPGDSKLQLSVDESCPILPGFASEAINLFPQKHRSYPSAFAMTLSSVLQVAVQSWNDVGAIFSFEYNDEALLPPPSCYRESPSSVTSKQLAEPFPFDLNNPLSKPGRAIVTINVQGTKHDYLPAEIVDQLTLVCNPLLSVGGNVFFQKGDTMSMATITLYLPLAVIILPVPAGLQNDDPLSNLVDSRKHVKPKPRSSFSNSKIYSGSFFGFKRQVSSVIPVDTITPEPSNPKSEPSRPLHMTTPRPCDSLYSAPFDEAPNLSPNAFRRENQRLRVLVMEGSSIRSAKIASTLRKLDCETIFAPNGKIGMQHWMQDTFDIVLVDLYMPVVSGLKVFQAITENRNEMLQNMHNSGALLVGMSALATAQDTAQGFSLGMHIFCPQLIDQPFLQSILSAVQESHCCQLNSSGDSRTSVGDANSVERTIQLLKATSCCSGSKSIFQFA